MFFCFFFSADEEKKSRYTRRKQLFYSAITQFSIKQTLADLEKTFKKIQAPHVISHYTAGARLIGLTTRQLEKAMKKMEKTAVKDDSPYAKPLHFVHLGTKEMVKRKRIKPTRTGPTARSGASSSLSGTKETGVKSLKNGEETEDKGDEKVDDSVKNLSQEIENQLLLLAQRGSIVAKLPDAHKILEWRHRIGSGKHCIDVFSAKHAG